MPKIFISPIQSSEDASKLITSTLQANRIVNGVTKDHKGNDYGVPTGTEISAIGDGMVVYSKLHKSNTPGSSYGNFIVVRHPATGLDSDGKVYYSKYAHLSTRDAKAGDTVKAGQVIGKSGGKPGLPESGDSTNPHLHLEVRIETKPEVADKLKLNSNEIGFSVSANPLAPNDYINYKQFSLKQQVEKLDGQYELEFRGNLGSDYISALGDQLFINDESLSGNALPLTNKNTNEIVPNIWKLTTNTYKREYILTRLDQNNKISSNGTKLLINPLGATNTENCIIINNFPFSESIKSAEEATKNNGVSTTVAPFGIKLSKNNQIDFSKIEFNQLSRSVGDIGSSAVNDNKIFSRKITKSIRKIILSLTILLMASLITIDTTQAKEIKKEQFQNKQVTTEYKSELVDKIIKAYKLDPKNNPKDQCRLMDVFHNLFTWYDSSQYMQQMKKKIDIVYIKFSKSNKEDISSINNDIFLQEFSIYYKDNKDGTIDDAIYLYFDKYGNPIGNDSAGDPPSNHCDTEKPIVKEHFFSLRKKQDKWNSKDLDVVDKNHPNVNLITKGYYVNYYNIK